MPTFRLEYSTNVEERPEAQELFSKLHKRLAELGPFNVGSMKSRIIPHEEFFVSDGTRDQAFVHLELSMLPGRSTELRKQVSLALLEFIKEEFSGTAANKNCAFSVDIRELDGDTYSKESSGTL